MSDVMEYKGYVGSVHYSAEDEVFHGKLEGIKDLVTYEGTDVASLKNAFIEAVEDYVTSCQKKKQDPGFAIQGNIQRASGAGTS
jgi:predicted HicB family RNase H-like nuclease